MTVSLHSATVQSFIRQLGALVGLIEKAEAYAQEKKLSDADILNARLAPDMFPFGMQVMQSLHHATGSLAGVRSGGFSPSRTPPPETLAALKDLVIDAIASLRGESADDVAKLADKKCVFTGRGIEIPFIGSGFLLSFSLPNFYFHITTAYDILRHMGLDIGKRDYMGMVQASSAEAGQG